MVALGYTYAVHGQPTLAWHLLEKAWLVRVQSVGADHTSTLHVMELLASQSFALHQYSHAAATYASCLKHYDKAPTPATKAARLTCANNLAAVYMCQGQYAHARALWTDCLEQDIQMHGLDSDLTLVSMANVAEVQRCLGEYMHAEWLVLSMWDRAKQLHGDSSEVALLGLATLGMVYRNQGSKEAAECLEQAFVKRKHRYELDGVGRDATCKSLYQWYGYCVDHLRFESLSNIESFEKHLHDLACDSETWHNERCHGCTKEIHGDVATCPQCVPATFQYCRACAAKSNKPKRRCAHTARLVTRKPPSRHLLEQRLQLLAMTDQHDLYDDWFERYDDYCSHHHVPHAKRTMQPRDEHQIAATCFACVPWL